MKVLSLHLYPVKACRGVDVAEVELGALGAERDRRFAFVDPDGGAITQREQPLLATVRPFLERDALRLDLGGLLEMRLQFSAFTEPAQVDVWGNRVAARAAAAPKAEDYLGMPLRLAMLDPAATRGFVDSRPILVASTGMLGTLNRQLGRPVGMERFRPNIVVDGAGGWPALRARELALELDKPCGRCEVTTIDQASGERQGDEPLRTLSERFKGNFGDYYRVTRGGRLRVGDALEP